MTLIVGIIGSTGSVGVELIRCLYRRGFPLTKLRLFASSKSVGTSQLTEFGNIIIEEYTLESARECQFIFLSVSGLFSFENAPLIAADGGPFVIDNSSAFRYNPEIPLVVPEINGAIISRSHKLIANPNCTTAIAAVVLWPLHQAFGIKKLILSTYQAASGAGTRGIEELRRGTAAYLEGQPVENAKFPHPLPFNLIPQIDKFLENGYTKEEMKIVWETRKIFGVTEDEMLISSTAVRVPVLRAHSESITMETIRPVSAAAAREVLSCAPGVRLVDDPDSKLYPMPLTASESEEVEVGRIRQSLIFGEYGLDLFVSGDQLLRGAALNAIQIAEILLSRT